MKTLAEQFWKLTVVSSTEMTTEADNKNKHQQIRLHELKGFYLVGKKLGCLSQKFKR